MLNRLVVAQNKVLDKLDPTMAGIAKGRTIVDVLEEDGWTIVVLDNGWRLSFEHSGQLVIQPQVN